MTATAEIRRSLKTAVGALANTVLRMRRPTKTPLVLLGNGRSGTSWVGKTLGQAANVIYYREPCNPTTAGVEDDTVWSRYVPPGGHDPFFESQLERAFHGLIANGSSWDVARCRSRLEGQCRIIVKEVATFLSVEWLYERWQPDVLLMTRHPCASGLSVLKLGLAEKEVPRLRQMLNDARLVSDHLEPFVDHLKRAVTPLQVSAAIWSIKNHVAFRSAKKYQAWKVVSYEELCANPVEIFRDLYETYDLGFTKPIENHIVQSTSSGDSSDPHATERNSAERRDAWRRQLDSQQVAEVRDIVDPFEFPFYRDEADWQT